MDISLPGINPYLVTEEGDPITPKVSTITDFLNEAPPPESNADIIRFGSDTTRLPTIASLFQTGGGQYFRAKYCAIPAWNMETTATCNIVTGITGQIMGGFGIVWNDARTVFSPVAFAYPNGSTVCLNIYDLTGATITVNRLDSTLFQSTDYNDTTQSRGQIVFFYVAALQG